MRYGILTGLLLSGFFAFCLLASGDEALKTAPQNRTNSLIEGQKLLKVKLYERTESAEKDRILAEHSIAAIPTRPFSFVSGGEVKATGFDESMLFGTRIVGEIADEREGAIRVAFKLSVGDRVVGDDPNTKVVNTQEIAIQTSLEKGTVRSLHVGGLVWCEISVE